MIYLIPLLWTPGVLANVNDFKFQTEKMKTQSASYGWRKLEKLYQKGFSYPKSYKNNQREYAHIDFPIQGEHNSSLF